MGKIIKKITFYKLTEKMPEDGDVVLIGNPGNYIECTIYKNGRFYDYQEMYYYWLPDDVEYWAYAKWED